MDIDGNWSEKVEDLIDAGEINEAISFLEKLVTDSPNSSDSPQQLSTVLLELSKLYSTKGLSLLADQTRTRAFLIKQQQESIKENRSEIDFFFLTRFSVF